MKVIAQKKKGLALFYGILGVILFVSGAFVLNAGETVGFCAILLAIFMTVISIINVKKPNDIISADESTGMIYLHPEDVSITARSIVDVSSVRGRMRYSLFKWGTVRIETVNNTYEYHFVADCERVVKDILRIKYTHMNK